MDKKNDFNCLEYIGNQIKAYVVNRLANAPCTTAQLVGTFSLIVDQLSISESSLTIVLDTLYKEKVIDFSLVNNNTRLYSLINFDKDYIFELNIEKVEGMIAEYKLPYFSNHRKDVQDPLYFEARKNRTCIYINAPLHVQETVKNEITDFLSANVAENDETSNIFDENVIDSSVSADESSQEIVENKDQDGSVSDDHQADETQTNVIETDVSTIDTEFTSENETQENAEFFESVIDETNVNNDLLESENLEDSADDSDNEVVQNSDEISQEVDLSEDPQTEESTTNSESEIPSDFTRESLTETVSDNAKTTVVFEKTNFDSIDFSSIDSHIDSYSESSNTASNSSPQDDSMDLFEQKFAEALAKAMALSSQNNDNVVSEAPVENIIEPTNESDISNDIAQSSSNDDLNVSPKNDDSSTAQDATNFDDNSLEPTDENKQNDNSQAFADDIVFTELQVNSQPVVNPEEERERQERALRMMEEILESKNTALSAKEAEPEVEFQFEEINDKIEINPEPIIVQKQPEQDKLTLYIKEQERINNYDWHNRLKRALVDVVEDTEEENDKQDEPTLSSTYSELKALMATKNYVFKSYPSHESKSFYTENYVFSNRLARSTALITYLFMLAEILVAYFFVDKFISKGFPFYLITAVTLLVIPVFFFLKYLLFKDKRKPANFVFGLSLVTSLMIYINLMVMVVLVAFFVPTLQVDVNNLKTMILTIFYPAGLFLGIPVSVCIYAILYRSKRYHLH